MIYLYALNSNLIESVFLTPAHKGWGYGHPLRRLGGGGHKVFWCSTA